MIISKVHRPKETIMVPNWGPQQHRLIDFCTMLPLSNLIIQSYISGVRLSFRLALCIAHIDAL